jgi:uncharacterized membrane protein YeaQ/YmgE (transglycosylase-associated protein family)
MTQRKAFALSYLIGIVGALLMGTLSGLWGLIGIPFILVAFVLPFLGYGNEQSD